MSHVTVDKVFKHSLKYLTSSSHTISIKLYLGVVLYLNVGPVVHIRGEEVAIEDRLLLDHILKLSAELGSHLLLQLIREPGPVLIVDQAVREDPQALMVPEPQQFRHSLQGRDDIIIWWTKTIY